MKRKTSALVLRGLRRRTFSFGMSKRNTQMANARLLWRETNKKKWPGKRVLLLLRLGRGKSKDQSWGMEPNFPFLKCQC